MEEIARGRYRARAGQTSGDLLAAQRLRRLAFFGPGDSRPDADEFDDVCTHILVEDIRSGVLVCCFRLLPLPGGPEIGRSYAAQFYDLSRLKTYPGAMAELGRFCLHPDHHDADILRLAWGAMARYVDAAGIDMLFGCSSFRGTVAAEYREAFALLQDRHLAPNRWRPLVKAPRVLRFARKLPSKPNLKAALQVMPPLLRTYLMMGGWVSDHAVVDREMNTLHVFTGVEIKAIPASRARLLRAVAG